jgi:15-cis-phytoene synthase
VTATGPAAATLAEAYQTCEAITREQARNFHYGIRLLPPAKRSALCAVYALARRIDDVGDAPASEVPAAQKGPALAAVRTAVDRLGVASTTPVGPALADLEDDPVLLAVADAARRYPIPLGAFGELVDGVEADVAADARAAIDGPAAVYGSFDDLIGYCRCVAGSVGRLCLGIFGTREDRPDGAAAGADTADTADAARLADTLGIALQQTNILRDVREDLLAGRIYLPADELDAYGVTLAVGPDGALTDPGGRLAELIRAAAERARRWYDDGLRLVPMLDRRSAACTAAMAGIYRRLLEEIAADPRSTYRRRRSLSTGQKVAVAARALAAQRSVR